MPPLRRLLPLLVVLAGLLVPLAASQGTLSITVYSDKTQYSLGENVRIFGKVADSQGTPVLGSGVSIQVGDPPTFIEVVYPDSSGAYSVSFVLSASVAPGQYIVYATASKPGYTSAQQQTQFTVLPETTTTTPTTSLPPPQPSKCLIATATYGSEIAPEVALLRNFRDAEIMKASSGRSFMQTFNAFYYSFSPQVASFIAAHGLVRSEMKMILYPLIAILYGSSSIFQVLAFDGELAVLFAGIFAAVGIGFVYLGPIAILGSRLVTIRSRSRRPTWKSVVLVSCVLATLTFIMVDVGRMSSLLAESAVAVVLSFLFLGALGAKSLYETVR